MNEPEDRPTPDEDLMRRRANYLRWLTQARGSPSWWVHDRFRQAATAYQAALLAEITSLKGVPGHRIVAEPGRAVVVIPS